MALSPSFSKNLLFPALLYFYFFKFVQFFFFFSSIAIIRFLLHFLYLICVRIMAFQASRYPLIYWILIFVLVFSNEKFQRPNFIFLTWFNLSINYNLSQSFDFFVVSTCLKGRNMVIFCFYRQSTCIRQKLSFPPLSSPHLLYCPLLID